MPRGVLVQVQSAAPFNKFFLHKKNLPDSESLMASWIRIVTLGVGKVSKRFTDTKKWENPWYRKMASAYRELWNYILDHCDNAGIWRVDLELASMIIGTGSFTLSDCMNQFSDRFVRIDHDKWFIPSFIEFQYGTLKSESKPHQSVIKILQKHGIDPVLLTLSDKNLYPLESSPDGIHTTKEKDKNKDKEKAKAFEGGPGETLAPEKTALIQNAPQTKLQNLSKLVTEWGKTLTHFKITKDPKFDEHEILRMLNREDYGFEKTRLAIIGQRYEEKTDSFNPGKHITIQRLSGKLIFEKCVNLGAQDHTPEKPPTAPSSPASKVVSSPTCQWCLGHGIILGRWREDPTNVDKSEDFACRNCKAGKDLAPMKFWEEHHAEKYIPRWEKI